MAKTEIIKGVSIKQIEPHHDDRGSFAEIIKHGEKTFHEIKQTSYTETYPGVIKAFHWHKKQWDIWFVARGMAQVVLHDLRAGSSTKGVTNVFYAGDKNMLLISIPPGVAHGYKVLGHEPVSLFYHTTEAYNPKNPDEERIQFDSPVINFDWQLKHR
jgi:dTDP-4-dehydrorhamnose 3,5-epimerase